MSLQDWKTYQNAISRQESITVPSWRTAAGEYPDPNFPFLEMVYTRDPDVYTNINFITNRALSQGYHFECTAQDAPNYMRSECEDFLKYFFDVIKWGDDSSERGFEPLSKTIVQELGWGGTHLLELIDPEDITMLAPVPLSSVWKWQRATDGTVLAIHQYPSWGFRPLTPSRYLNYRWNVVNRNPWGYGLIHPLAYPRVGPRGEVIPPLILSWWQMQDDAVRRLHRAGTPRTIVGFEGLPESVVAKMSEALQDPEPDATIASNAPVSIAMDSPTGRMNFQPEFDMMGNRIQIGLNSMIGAMIASDKGFSFSSSKTGYSMVDIVVWDLQRNFKRTTDFGLVTRVAEQNGFDVQLLRPELIFNQPDEPETDHPIADITAAVTAGWITKEEARLIVKQQEKWPIPEQLPPELLQPQLPAALPQPGMQPSMNVPPSLAPKGNGDAKKAAPPFAQ